MTKNGGSVDTIFISNIPLVEKYIAEAFINLNGLRWKDIIIIFSRMVLKRSAWDRIREGGGPPGFAELDDHFTGWLDEQVGQGKADQELVDRYKNLSLIERYKHQLKPVNRTMLKEIVERVEKEMAEAEIKQKEALEGERQ